MILAARWSSSGSTSLRRWAGAWAIYELLPAFLAACIAIVIVSLATPAPEKAVTDTFDEICGK